MAHIPPPNAAPPPPSLGLCPCGVPTVPSGGAGAGAGGAGAEGADVDIPWLCQHRPDAMCVNCAPLRKKGEAEAPLEMLCLHGPDARCINCLPAASTVGDRKFVTYDEWIEKQRSKCEHAFSAVCVNCMPPSDVVYCLKPNCPRHKPWPGGLCSDCQPPAVPMRLQEYRHVDNVQFLNSSEVQRFVALWDANAGAGVQRAAFLYGQVVDDEANFRHGQRVLVHAMYEPPQRFDVASGAIAILPDKRAKDVEAVAAACGLRRVGWFITQKAKSKPSDSAVTPRELNAMARLQLMHARGGGRPGSQFVTVTVRRVPGKPLEPSAFMASDTVTAMVRDGVVADPLPADELVRIRQPRPGTSDPPAPEVVVTSLGGQVRRRAAEFDADLGIITVETTEARAGGAGAAAAAAPRVCRFKHADFPVENREAFGHKQDAPAARAYLQRFRAEPPAQRLSDFHLLVFLAQLFDVDTAVAAARAVAEGRTPPEGIMYMLDDIMSGPR